MIAPADELERIHGRESVGLIAALADLARAQLLGKGLDRAERRLEAALAGTFEAGDILGRYRLLLELQAAGGPRLYAFGLSGIPFLEAARAILERVSVIGRGYEVIREKIGGSARIVARFAGEAINRHVQKTIAQAVVSGQRREVVVNEIAEALGARQLNSRGVSFISSYADTVFRTTTTRSYADGRIAQVQHPEVRPFVGAWRYDATLDGDVRPNHRAADGFIAALEDPVWRQLTPPLGFNCRCALGVVTAEEARRARVIDREGRALFRQAPPGAGPDRDFRR